MANYMLDTSAIGQLEEWDIDLDLLANSNGRFYMTHVQEDELDDIGDAEFRQKMKSIFDTIEDDNIPTGSFVFGHSKLGRAKLGGGGIFDSIRNDLADAGGNEIKDALMAETALTNGCTFVTHDGEIYAAVEAIQPENVMMVEEFCRQIGASISR